MTVNYAPRARTGTRSRDVQNPIFKEAEQRVYEWLQANGYSIVDLRAQKTYADFRFGAAGKQPVFTLDVKADQYASETGRVAWEIVVENRGRIREGWGMYKELDYVAFVLPNGPEPLSWPLYMVDVKQVQRALDTIVEQHGDYVRFDKRGEDGRRAEGVAISLAALRQHGCIVHEAAV